MISKYDFIFTNLIFPYSRSVIFGYMGELIYFLKIHELFSDILFILQKYYFNY